jgi:hypothetical protein
LPNVGGITEMLKIMAVSDTHKVGIVPHFTGPIATADHLHRVMAFPGRRLRKSRPAPLARRIVVPMDHTLMSHIIAMAAGRRR